MAFTIARENLTPGVHDVWGLILDSASSSIVHNGPLTVTASQDSAHPRFQYLELDDGTLFDNSEPSDMQMASRAEACVDVTEGTVGHLRLYVFPDENDCIKGISAIMDDWLPAMPTGLYFALCEAADLDPLHINAATV